MSRIFVEMTEEEYQEYCELKQENESSDQKEEHNITRSTRDCIKNLINMMIKTSEETYFDPTIDRFVRLTRYRTAGNNLDVELVTKEYDPPVK